MTSPLIRRTIDVVLGSPQLVAERIQTVCAAHDVAATCHVHETVVRVEVSTLALADARAGERVDEWIEQAATDLAASIQWRDEE